MQRVPLHYATGIVHQHIERPEALLRLSYQGSASINGTDIGPERDGVTAGGADLLQNL